MFVAAMPELRADRQLHAIEASIVPHMKPDDAKKVMQRHRRTLTPPEEKKQPAAMALLDGFREAGFQIKHV